ncbi:MAG: hypothetical protein ACR9NN_19120 [Nostochopsis sp.]
MSNKFNSDFPSDKLAIATSSLFNSICKSSTAKTGSLNKSQTKSLGLLLSYAVIKINALDDSYI